MKLTISLSESSINEAIRQLKQYKRYVDEKTKLLKQRIAKELAIEAQSGFTSAIVDDLLKGGGKNPEVEVSINESGGTMLVIASGEDAIWCEFGSGIYHNTPVGTSPHPRGAEMGFTIGGYGKGYGSRSVWGFYQDGELKLTHGTKAQMPMYNAVKTISERVDQIAREVFA